MNIISRMPGVAAALVLALLLTGTAGATSVDDLYEASVEVADQSRAERDKGFATALWDVLVKVTGDRSVPSRPELQVLFQRAPTLVQQYRYQLIEQPAESTAESEAEQPAPADDAASAAAAVDMNLSLGIDVDTEPAGPTHLMFVEFAAHTINRQLQNLGVPIWGPERPETLVWLAVQDGGERYIVGADTESEVTTEVLQAAGLRGLPILLPVMDYTDRARVTFADLRGNFAAPVLEASQRYGVENVLAGNLARVSEQRWVAQWTVYRYGQSASWRAESADMRLGLLSGIEGTAGLLARELALGGYGTSSARLRITVREVRATSEYAQVVDYLRGLSLVEDVMVDRVTPEELTVSMSVRGSRLDLQRTIALGDMLVSVPGQAVAADAANADLIYALLR